MPSYSGSGGSSRSAKRPAGTSGGSLPTPKPVGTGSSMPIGNPDGTKQRQAKKMLMDATQLSLLQNNLRIASLYVNSRHLEMLSPATSGSLYTSEACKFNPIQSGRSGIAVYQITKLMYNEDENSFEKLVSVYSALNSFGGIVALILQSDGNTTRLYLCTNTSGNGKVAGGLLANNLRGQFPGCEIDELSDTEKNKLLDSCGMVGAISTSRTVRSLSMIPSRREDERQHDKEFSAQGYEKFVDAMNGHRYTLVVLSQRVSPDAMDGQCK